MSSATVTIVPTGTWTIDPDHSQVGFAVRHMGIATVRGEFAAFTGTLGVADDFAASTVDAQIEASSVTTGNDERDAHLRSDDFLRADAHPHIAYRAARLEATGDDTFAVDGELTVAGTTRPVRLKAEVNGLETDPYGNERVGLELTGKLSRKEFGMTFNQMLGGGNMLVGDDVKITIDVSAIRQAAK